MACCSGSLATLKLVEGEVEEGTELLNSSVSVCGLRWSGFVVEEECDLWSS